MLSALPNVGASGVHEPASPVVRHNALPGGIATGAAMPQVSAAERAQASTQNAYVVIVHDVVVPVALFAYDQPVYSVET